MSHEEIESVFSMFFKIPLNLFGVTNDSGSLAGYSATPGKVEPEDTLEEHAAQTWDQCFRGRTFIDPVSILVTYMDCFLEQKEIADLIKETKDFDSFATERKNWEETLLSAFKWRGDELARTEDENEKLKAFISWAKNNGATEQDFNLALSNIDEWDRQK